MNTINPPVSVANPANQHRLNFIQEVASQPDFDYPPVNTISYALIFIISFEYLVSLETGLAKLCHWCHGMSLSLTCESCERHDKNPPTKLSFLLHSKWSDSCREISISLTVCCDKSQHSCCLAYAFQLLSAYDWSRFPLEQSVDTGSLAHM